MRPDRNELMRSRESAKDGVVPHAHVAGKRRDVGEDRMIADLAVVRDMDIGHDPIVAADPRHARVLHSTAIEGAKLSNGISVPDFERRRFAAVLLVLGRPTDRTESENTVLRADPGPSFDHHVRSDQGAFADLDVLADDRIRADRYAGGDCRFRMNDGGRMDHSARRVHNSLASAASASPTRARAASFQSPRAWRSIDTSSTS